MSEKMALPKLLDKVEQLTEKQQKALMEASKLKGGGRIPIDEDLDFLIAEGYIKLIKELSPRMKYAPVMCEDWYSRDQLHKFLHRKYDGLTVSAYEARIDIGGDSTGFTAIIPSDAAMKELIKRGYYDENGKRLKKV